VVEVLGIDVGDDGDRRRQLEKAPVALVGLGDEEVPLAEARVAPQRVDLAADDHRGIQPRRAQHRGDERRRRRLAVRPGDGDGVANAHQLGEHLGARDDGDLQGTRAGDLRVVRVDGARVDEDVGAAQVVRGVADEDPHAEALQATRVLVGLEVRAADVEVERAEDLGETAHPMPPMPTKCTWRTRPRNI